MRIEHARGSERPMHNRLSSLFLPTLQLPCRMKLWVVTMLVASLIGADQSFAEERCEQPDALGNSLVRPDNRLGEFRLKLNPPDYLSAISVRNHVAFSGVLVQLLRSSLSRHTNGQCRAVITSTTLVPDLRVYLSWRGSPGASAADRSLCARALQDQFLELRPTKNAVNEVASREADANRQSYSSPAGPAREIQHYLRLALASIYDHDSALQALVSADMDYRIFQSLDIDAFLTWLEKQRLVPGERLIPINICNSEVSPQSSHDNMLERRVPASATIPPGALHLSTIRAKDALARPTPPLRHFVIVGNNRKIGNVPLSTPATDKLCNRPYAIPLEKESAPDHPASVTIRCVPERLYGVDHWITFFCDPNDCRSDRAAQAAMAAIAIDPDVVDLAGGDSERTRPRGPYLVDVDVTYE